MSKILEPVTLYVVGSINSYVMMILSQVSALECLESGPFL